MKSDTHQKTTDAMIKRHREQQGPRERENWRI